MCVTKEIADLRKKVIFIASDKNPTAHSEFIPLSVYLDGKGIDSCFIVGKNCNPVILKSLDDNKRSY